MGAEALIEPNPIEDIFCTGIGAIEDVGDGNLRFWFYAKARREAAGVAERVVVAKLVMAATAIPVTVLQELGSAYGIGDIASLLH